MEIGPEQPRINWAYSVNVGVRNSGNQIKSYEVSVFSIQVESLSLAGNPVTVTVTVTF